ncbi:hypothetical protein HanRHA438_Chr13g0604511 [Helianthus annuus]|uniref:Uncharacterized protein n=1 Tax=Helianthus annuus TaxID=4232 RepID=A0A9K3EIZ0_HELAN|nr:hypothetical protein HanXRQr2_Chr13g0593871 [Helianthus annuus]KAJ0477325.1 hypothetical protein HanHA300_Chr13g0487141 [Helianthus annuus]KAJ0481746.1 hypothetical protein HanIR_Chr13g0646071 [Helianthus annuus]KAJ0498160.1 hypothetical protein HanHA89_Chr13g0519311 [Helianthus annuus]KAJ0664161.1 hypothetical protein HanLR1_Chr13g0489151 [Helianthus annuus]
MAAYIKEKISAHLFIVFSAHTSISESLLLVSTVDHQWMIIGFCAQKLLIGDRSA